MRKDIIWYIFLGLILLTISWIVGYNMGMIKGKDQMKLDMYENLTTERDTVTVRDTITVTKPVPTYKIKYKEKIDTIYKHITDTDTIIIPVSLPIVEKEYSSSDYKAVIKGAEIGSYPTLESIQIFKEDKYITETKVLSERKKWGWNATLGVGAGWNPNTKKFEPTIGVIIGYGINIK